MTSKIDKDKRAEYWRIFEDGSPQRWKSGLEQDTWVFEFPNGAVQKINRDHPNFNWAGKFEVDSDSTRLWVNSLRYLVDVLEASDTRFVVAALESFHAYQREFRDRPKELFSGSIDHQCALQLRTCCEISAWQAKNPSALSDGEHRKLDSLLGGIVTNIRSLVDELNLLQANNHGIMLGIAALHSTYFFSGESVNKHRETNYVEFLYDSLSDILGNDGLADENTGIYQAFYVRLLGEITDFLHWVEDAADTQLDALAELASTALRHLLLPNNSVPPIGDGAASSQSKFRAKNGLWQSRENGIFVHSTDETYLSFVCGFRGVFHKQMDDTSIILWHKGKYLIQDAGLASYDKNDPVAVSLRTQVGHSGVFFKEFDDISAEKVISYGAQTRLVRSVMEPFSRTADGKMKVKGTVDFRNTRTERTLTFSGENSVIIRDEVNARDGKFRAVSRFLLDPSAEVSFAPNGSILIRNGKVWLKLSQQTGISNAKIYRGDKSIASAPRGFLAPKNYSMVPTYLIEIPLTLDEKGKGKTSIRLDFGVEDCL